jgi:hypothetical protein
MQSILIISGTFHLLALLFLAVLLWERNWWRREAEFLQTQFFKTQLQLRAMIQDVKDTKQEMDSWERKAADLWGETGGER